MRTFQPDVIVLDLMLPKMSGVDVIKQIRSEAEFAKLPIIVFSNTYLTNMIQEAWKAGATKCLSKANCSPKEVLDMVRHTIGDSGAMPQRRLRRPRARRRKAKPRHASPARPIPNFRPTCGKHSLTACPPRSPRCAPTCKASSRPTTK